MLRQEHAIWVRWISHDAHSSVHKRDGRFSILIWIRACLVFVTSWAVYATLFFSRMSLLHALKMVFHFSIKPIPV